MTSLARLQTLFSLPNNLLMVYSSHDAEILSVEMYGCLG
jgi:hypothetical protein